MAKGWTTIALRNDLVARIDAFVENNSLGFTSRGVLVAEVMRRFLDKSGDVLTRDELERALRAVAATEPETPTALLEALLAELDMDVRHAPHHGTTKAPISEQAKSSSESTKRR